MNNNVKICFVASSGGHYEQLMMLKPLMKTYDSFIVTEKTKYELEMECAQIYYLHQINRKEKVFLIYMVLNAIQSIKILIKEHPNVVISTGALATIPICLFAKLLKKKLIYIESFAKVISGTKTGKLMYQFADQFYVQWETMLCVYPDAIFLGAIY